MTVTIQLVAGDDSSDEVRITSEVEVATGGDAHHLADAIATRARDAALCLVEHERSLAPVAASHRVATSHSFSAAHDFVPLAVLLPRA